MNLPLASVLAFAAALLISVVSSVNVGLISIAFAFIVGVFLGGMKVGEIAAGFPSSLLLTLVGITLLFSQARVNGTLDGITRRSVRLARGNLGMIPVIFFLLAAALSAIGAGNIATVAILAPIAMTVSGRVRISAFLMTIVVCCGANAGTFSPFAPPGVIADGILERVGITGQEWPMFLNNLIAQSFIGLGGYLLLGGYKLFRSQAAPEAFESALGDPGKDGEGPGMGSGLRWQQGLTLAVIAALIVGVSYFKIDPGMGAFLGAAILTLARAANEETAVKGIPWNVIIMVCGVTVLISILERKGGMDLFTSLLARFATKDSVTGVIAFVTGLISVYSSSSGVVMPAFLPTIPSLIEKLGGGDPVAIASSINVGTFLVDASPLSTLGALCIANADPSEDRKALFNKLLAWGLSMSVVGAVVCWLFFGVL
ncbi:MAG: C4-dicarboxylate ABC transporter [Acidobacteria bacterium]|nr:C4-dicarboxylate ABC transporter [Acidobacteriota bacterium]